MNIYISERAAWEAAAVGYLVKIAGMNRSSEEYATIACELADALILEMRKRPGGSGRA